MKKTILTTLIILIVFFSVFPLGIYPAEIVYADHTPRHSEVEQPPPLNLPDCGWGEVACAVKRGFNWALERVASFPVGISGFLVQLTGTLLNLAVIETVVKLGSNIDKISTIDTAWGTLRDLANIFFIFGLLTIAISTILGLQTYGYKKLLAKLIIVALLINFSMFFTKFVIDVSNIFSLQFYQAMVAPGADGITGIANAFTRGLGISSAWETSTILDTLKNLNYNEDAGLILMFTYAFFVTIFFTLTAFVFVFAAIMLITRAVGLIFLIILSPLAFAAMILPKTQSIADDWWEKLWQYAIFAPLLMLFFWITASIIPGITATFGSTGGLIDSFGGTPQARLEGVGMVLNFIIIISFIIASIIVSNKLSLAFGKQATALAGKVSFGTLGSLGRNTFGRGFSKISQSDGLKEAASKGGLTGLGARLALKTMRAGAKANYDLRSAPGARAVLKGVEIDAGKPQKGGYEATFKKQVEDRKKFAESLGSDTAGKEAEKIALEKELKKAEERGDIAKRAEIKEKIKNTEKEIENLKEVGKSRKEAYAETLATQRTFDTLFLKVSRKNKAAAATIRKGKTEGEKIIEAVAKEIKDKEKTELKETPEKEDKEE